MMAGLQIARVRRAIKYALLAAPAAMAAALMLPAQVAATINGPCQGHGYAGDPTPVVMHDEYIDPKKAASTVDFHAAIWQVPSYRYYLYGEGSADGAMSSGVAYVEAFGQTFKVAGGEGSGDKGKGGFNPGAASRHWLPGPLADEPPAAFIFVSGNAQPDRNASKPASGPCDGHIVIQFMDASPEKTAEGQVGIFAMILGGVGLAGTALRKM